MMALLRLCVVCLLLARVAPSTSSAEETPKLPSRDFIESLSSPTLNHYQRLYVEADRSRQRRESLSRPLDGERFGDFNLQSISMHLEIDRFDFPDEVEFEVTLVANAPLDTISLLAYYYAPTQLSWINDIGADEEIAYDWVQDEGRLDVRFPRELSLGERVTLRLRGSINFNDLDPLSALNDGLALHHIAPEILPLNYEFYDEDLFILRLSFDVLSPSLYPAASGQVIERPDLTESLGEGRWVYESEYVNNIPAFTLTKTPPVAYEGPVELFAPEGVIESGVEMAIGSMAFAPLTYYGDLYFPYPYSRLGVSPLSDDAGVALGPMAQILIPYSFWWIDERESEEIKFSIESTISHELAHQYFYNWIRLNSRSSAWLSEAFAEYSATRYMKHAYQSDRHRIMNYKMYMSFFSDQERPIIDPRVAEDLEAYFYVVYLRGSSVLNQLKLRMSDFDERLSEYVQENGQQFVYDEDLFETLRRMTPKPEFAGFDLNAFIELWILNTYRARWNMGSSYLDDDRSYLLLESDVLSADFIVLRAHNAQADEQVIPLSPIIDATHTFPGIDVDPDLMYFRTLNHLTPVDVDLNGVIDGMDMLDVLSRQGREPSDDRWRALSDVNQNGLIDEDDVDRCLERFGDVIRGREEGQ